MLVEGLDPSRCERYRTAAPTAHPRKKERESVCVWGGVCVCVGCVCVCERERESVASTMCHSSHGITMQSNIGMCAPCAAAFPTLSLLLFLSLSLAVAVSCYGAETDERKCCNTCAEVQEAYRIKGWALTDIEGIVQCEREGAVSKRSEQSQRGRERLTKGGTRTHNTYSLTCMCVCVCGGGVVFPSGWTEKLKAQAKEGCRIYGHLEVNKVWWWCASACSVAFESTVPGSLAFAFAFTVWFGGWGLTLVPGCRQLPHCSWQELPATQHPFPRPPFVWA